MKKSVIYMAAFATLGLATSCSQDALEGTKFSNNEIGVHASLGDNTTRAVETTISNLGSFTLNTFQDGDDNYMSNVKYSSTDGSTWTTEAGKFFWPVEGDLHFYGYAPETPGQSGTFKIDKDAQTLTDFSPNAAASEQKDFVYTSATGNGSSNGETGIDLNFKHALTEISIGAKNSNTAYTVTVTGVRIGNVKTKGTFTFPSTTGTDASWSLSDASSDKGNYETSWTEGVTLGSEVSTLGKSNVPFMIIPQSLTSMTKYADGNYIAMKVKITMQGGKVLHDGWAYIGIDTNWEMGKHYVYTLDFSNGAGQDDNGKDIISGKNIKLNVSVTVWDKKNSDIPNYICGTCTDDFEIRINGIKRKVTKDKKGQWKYEIRDAIITDLSNLFDDARSIKNVDFKHIDTSHVTNMSSMFSMCWWANIDVSNLNTSKATNLSSMFYYCLNDVKGINNLNTSNVTNMSYMFSRSSISNLDVSNYDTSNVTDMSGMFKTTGIKSFNLSKWTTSKVANMSYMFSNNVKIENLDLSNWDTSNVTDMHNMFEECSFLTILDLSNWDMRNVTNTAEMFNGCPRYITIYVDNCDASTVEKIKSAVKSAGLSENIVKTRK